MGVVVAVEEVPLVGLGYTTCHRLLVAVGEVAGVAQVRGTAAERNSPAGILCGLT